MSLDNLSINFMEQRLQILPKVNDDPYIRVYDSLVASASKLNDGTIDGLISVAHIAYGWMPTILTVNQRKAQIDDFFLFAPAGSLDKEFLRNLKTTVNNSIVGGSKVLHFFYPGLYPIWDSKVYKTITTKHPYDYRVNDIPIYIDYVQRMRGLAEDDTKMNYFKGRLISLGYCSENATKLRVLELILFYS